MLPSSVLSDADAGAVSRSPAPLKSSPPPILPLVQTGPPALSVPTLPLPDESAAVLPESSLSFQCTVRAGSVGGGGGGAVVTLQTSMPDRFASPGLQRIWIVPSVTFAVHGPSLSQWPPLPLL